MQALLNNISQYITMSIKNLLGKYEWCLPPAGPGKFQVEGLKSYNINITY
jgi:hypothetical protein